MKPTSVSAAPQEFSFRSRARSIDKFKSEVFDLLIIGGGITGAAAARDAASRGLRVALVEKRDFAWGTSSRSSKLIHGGLRYLENFEFALVFEALSERAFLLKTAPNRVRPLPFYFPVYQSDPHGMGILSMGFWLYDLLSLFRAPGSHRRLSKQKLIDAIPTLKQEGLAGGFKYFDASMWDDSLVVETLRSAQGMGAAIANYVEAVNPIWHEGEVTGFEAVDHESAEKFSIRAHRTVVCAGPWTDLVCQQLSPDGWKPWLSPSQGTHLVFDFKRIPVPGAVVMSHPQDGRISFVIPRPDFGAGVTIVGTTDGPSPSKPEEVKVSPAEVQYLLELLQRYFPNLKLTASDILSAYVGIRPLYGGGGGSQDLQKVSREHYIGEGPGRVVIVAGGKYTTSRNMGEEIIDFLLDRWRDRIRSDGKGHLPNGILAPKTKVAINPAALPRAVEAAKAQAKRDGLEIPARLYELYGADALEIVKAHSKKASKRAADPEGFPELESTFRWSIENEMVLHLEDFYFRRLPLFLADPSHGLPWSNALAEILATERAHGGLTPQGEVEAVRRETERRLSWKAGVTQQ